MKYARGSSPFRRRRGTVPPPGIVFGETGTVELEYKGKATGAVTCEVYTWREPNKLTRDVDIRDLASVKKAGGARKFVEVKAAPAEEKE